MLRPSPSPNKCGNYIKVLNFVNSSLKKKVRRGLKSGALKATTAQICLIVEP